MGKKDTFEIRHGNCHMTIRFGPGALFEFSNDSPGFVVPGMITPGGGAIPNRMTAATPLFSFNVDKGSVKFRESYRKVLSDGTAHAPPVFVSATVKLKAGEYTFQIAFDSPAPRDITLTFTRPAGVEWDTPFHKHERIAESYLYNLIVTKHLAQWAQVHEIQVILREGLDCQHLPIDELLRFCKTHEKSDPATAFLGRYRKALNLESLARESELADMARKRLTARVTKDPKRDLMVLEFPAGDDNGKRWNVEEGLMVNLRSGGPFSKGPPVDQ